MSAEHAAPCEVLTVREAAGEMRVSTETIYRMIASGKLAHWRVGAGSGSIRIRREDLETATLPVRGRPAKGE